MNYDLELYRYRTVTLTPSPERDIALDVAPAIEGEQIDGWEFVSGPAIEPSGRYVLLFRIPEGAVMKQEDRGRML